MRKPVLCLHLVFLHAPQRASLPASRLIHCSGSDLPLPGFAGNLPDDLECYFVHSGIAGLELNGVPKLARGRDADQYGLRRHDPVKLELHHSGRTIDLGFYSRRREINEESSFSVLG